MEPSGSPEESYRESVGRFAQDMAVLRTRTGVSLHDLHRSTKISLGILEEFERSGLIENPLFNRVYLRSFISTYASTLGLDKKSALDALEEALSGTYDGGLVSLTDSGLQAEAEADATSSPTEADGGTEEQDRDRPSTQTDLYHEAEINRDDEIPRVSESGKSEAPDNKGGREYEPGVARRFRFEPIRPEAPRRTPAGDVEPKAEEPTSSQGAKRRTEISTAVRDFREPEPQKGLIIPPNRVKTIALIVLVIAITVSAAALAFRLSTNAPSTEPSSDAIGIPNGDQTALVQAQPASIEPVVPIPVIGDTIVVTLVADGRPLDPIRVRVDRDLRRPYWINTGDSLSFAMTNQIVLDSLLQATVVKLEGVEYPRDIYRARSSVVITRDSVLRFVESLAAR